MTPWWSVEACRLRLGPAEHRPPRTGAAGYALVPIAFLVLVEFGTEVARAPGGRLRWLLATVATIGVPVAGTLLVLVATSTATETAALYEALAFSSSAYAFPSQVDRWVTNPLTLASSIFWAVPVTLVIGVTGLLLQRGRLRPSYAAVTALGLLGFMMMQKQILRPGVERQVWLPLLFGLAYWLATDTLLS